MKTSRARGFTLIELLVVVAIISLLSAVVITSLSTTRDRARDTNRVQEMKQIQTALELYYSKHGSYPLSVSTGHSNWASECDSGRSTFVIPELVSDPSDGSRLFAGIKDPVLDCSSHHWGYTYASDGINYKLLSHTEDSAPKLRSFIDPAQDGGPDICFLDGTVINDTGTAGVDAREHYGVWTDGARCWQEMNCDPSATDATRCSLDPDGVWGSGTNH
jgi:prepilin-type N-terminal cleavage/methylation domain-containing protein